MSFTLFSTRKSEINDAIASIQSQIASLQQQLADQQAFLQEIGTVEQAGESAINQTLTFLTMVRAIDPSQEVVFWQAMEALKATETELLAPSNDPEPDNDPTSPTSGGGMPIEDATEEGKTIDAIATPIIDAEDTPVPPTPVAATLETTKEDVATQLADNDTQPLTADELKAIRWNDMKKLCLDKGVTDPTGQRLTRKFAQTALLGKLIRSDISNLYYITP